MDDVLKAAGGRQIDERQIRAAINVESREIAKLRAIESSQSIPRIHELLDLLQGLPIPCSIGQLEKKIGSGKQFWEDCQSLWSWNILGIELNPANEDATEMLKRNFGRSHHG